MTDYNAQSPQNNAAINEYVPEIISKRVFSRREIVMAYIALVLGFLFIKLTAAPFLTGQGIGLGAMIFLIALTFFSNAFSAQCNKITVSKALRIALCISFAINIFISSNSLIQFLDAVFVFLVITYDRLADSDKKFSRIRRMFPTDLCGSVFILPFSDIDSCTAAVKASAESSKAGKGIKNALLGLAIAVPSTVVVCSLLMSADNGFENIINGFFDNGLNRILILIIQILIGIPAASYIYGMCRASAENKSSECINDEYFLKNIRSLRFLPSTAGVFSAIPVCVLYVIFFFSQLSYFLSSFAAKLPDDTYSYAQYARRGFFELCMVSVINLAIIAAINLFCKYREDGARPLSVRIITCILSVFTILLIATAVSKMVMYIDVYGLTLLRVYTTWFMILLAVIFIGIVLTMISKKVNLPRLVITAFTVMFACLSFCNVDGVIAEYNADRYLNGTLKEFDVSMISELSSGAVPAASKLYGKLETKEANDELYSIITGKAADNAGNDARSLTVEEILADEAINDLRNN